MHFLRVALLAIAPAVLCACPPKLNQARSLDQVHVARAVAAP